MKITDTELLDAIWENQLRLVADDVIHNYAGGGKGLCCVSDFWYKSSSSEHIRTRYRITKKIKEPQLLNRLKQLKAKGFIETDYDRDGLFLTFMIVGNTSREVFEFARQFWLDKGIPEGSYKLDDGRDCMCTTKKVDVEALLPECIEMLNERFGGSRPRVEDC